MIQFIENDDHSYLYQSDDEERSTSVAADDSFEINPMREIEKNEMEDSFLLQSTLSNTVFLVAGSFYLTVSIWDLKPPKNEVDIAAYDIIAYLAPFTYLFNSVIDIHLANRIRVYRKFKRRGATSFQEQMVTIPNSHYNYFQDHHTNDNDPSSVIIGDQNMKRKKKKSKRKRLRKFAAHRRDLSAAVSFFLAALASVFSVIAEWLGASDETLAGFDGLSVHLYMLSAVIAILGSRIFAKGEHRCSFLTLNFQDADTLETLGDLFFLIGSFVDSILFDFSFDDEGMGWPILSSTLWCVDALLYLNSDWIAAKSRQNATESFLNSFTKM